MKIRNLFLALAGVVTGFAVATLPLSAQTTSYVLVAKGQGKGSTPFAASVAKAGGQVVANLEEIGVVLAASANPGFADAVKSLPFVQQVAADMKVQWLSPNEQAVLAEGLEVNPAGVNSEPFDGFLWNLSQIEADKTAAAGYLGYGARVAVLDSGLWWHHPDIEANVNFGQCRSFVPGEVSVVPTQPGFSHGTHVAGIIAAPINNRGIQGVAPEAEIVAVKVLSESGSGEFGWVIQGIVYATWIDADVINMSLGATFPRVNAGGGGAGPLIAALNRAINYATASGVLVVSAAGNEGVDLNSMVWSIPAQCGDGMAVSATGPDGQDCFDRLASYSNFGQSVVNVAAPGGDFVNEDYYPFDMVLSPAGKEANGAYSYYFAAGTSMAAPHVSGLAALLVGKYGHMPPAQLKALIQKSADDILKPGADAGSGHGRINAWNALQ